MATHSEETARSELLALLPPHLHDQDVLEITLPSSPSPPLSSAFSPGHARSLAILELTDAMIQDPAASAQLTVLPEHIQNRHFDVVVFSRVLVFLSDAQTKAVAKKVLQLLRPDGVVVFRESCFDEPFPVVMTTDSSLQPVYRHPSFYVGCFGSAYVEGEVQGFAYLDFVLCTSLAVYRQATATNKRTHGELCFVYKKVVQPGDEEAENSRGRSASEQMDTFQTFLDNQQYSNASITRYEKIFGSGYVSTGGQQTTTEFVAKLDLKPGQKVLDVGCGIGGGDFYMANTFGVSVLGIDLSTNMVFRAMEQFPHSFSPDITAQATLPAADIPGAPDVAFEICDAISKHFPPGSFDVIYSRDTILHIEGKAALFTQFLNWLKPGGKLLISDYCCGEPDKNSPSQSFTSYVKRRGYSLLSPSQYGDLLSSVGFTEVITEDRTNQFMEVLSEELERTKRGKEAFIAETSEADYNAIVQGWEAKLARCGDGDQKWGLFLATKKRL